MSEKNNVIKRFDNWLTDDSDVAALVMRQWLEPVEGKDGVIFPPTYARPERAKDEDWTGYNLDRFEDGMSVCQIDSVGSQANRMEPIFLRDKYKALVPQVVIVANGKKINLLDAGHRAADAIIRFSNLAQELKLAFQAIREGDASKIAKIAPTSLVFGAWDSRDTQVKLPRIVRSVIRAFNVRPLHRSAQYIPPIDYVEEGLVATPEGKQQQDALSQHGLSHAPAPWTHGGVLVEQEIRRDATLNLAALRSLGADPIRELLPVRRYILGLSLVAFTAPQESFLREGCQLVPEAGRPAAWALVKHDGSRDKSFTVSHEDALAYATGAAEAFGVGPERNTTFEAASAKNALGQSKKERKASRGKGSKTESEPTT
jgi:CRISPR-associated protein Csb1